MSTKRISNSSPITVGGKIGEITVPIPAGIPMVLRKMWKTVVELARKFSKHLAKDRTEEFLKVVRKDFESRNEG